MQTESSSCISLLGRSFRGVSQGLSSAQDDYVMGHLRAAGVLEMLMDLPAGKGKKKKSGKDKDAEAMLTAILLSGRKQHILAGMLTEVGATWTREEADVNAAAFGEITDNREKQVMYAVIVGCVLGFFASGGASLTTSPSSSSPSITARAIDSVAASTSESSN